MLNWWLGAVGAVVIAFVIYLYRWLDAVKDNHLTHIQSGIQTIADHSAQTNARLAELAIREEERHKQEQMALGHLTDLIRSRGL